VSIKQFVPLLAALVFTACGSLGGVFGGPADTSPPDNSRVNTDRADLRGTVVEVNTSARRITLDADSAGSTAGNTLQRVHGERIVYYDERTVVEFAGETYRPEALERGDEVNVRFTRQTDSNLAERITVLHDVRASGTGAYDADLPTEVRGTVGTVNTDDRLIEVDQTQGDRGTLVYYDERTVVHFDGRQYKPENLERGDEIRVTGQRRDNRFLADTITVERDVRASSGGYEDALESEVRGTVRSMSSRDRLIQLDLAYGERGDDRIYWDERTVVELQGRQFRPDRLVAGDEIEVRGTRRDNRFLADTIRVVREAGRTE
jgi:hypothetical protein